MTAKITQTCLRRWIPRGKPGAGGFTLIEMAMMMVVFSLVLVGGMNAIRVQTHKTVFENAKLEMRAIQDAMLGFLTMNGRLPCPDTDFDGIEQPTCPALHHQGQLPWRTLGVHPLDAWGHLYTYHVTPSYAVSIAKAGDGDITIKNVSGVVLATGIPLIVLSHGKNGLGGFSMNGSPMPPPTLTHELENTTNNGIFIHGTSDDLLIWLPRNVVNHYAVKSGYSLYFHE